MAKVFPILVVLLRVGAAAFTLLWEGQGLSGPGTPTGGRSHSDMDTIQVHGGYASCPASQGWYFAMG
jgi:hypothetical protein